MQISRLSRRILGLAVGACLGSLLQAAPTAGDADFPAQRDNARHQQKIEDVRSGDYELVLVGDSITQCLESGGEWAPLKVVWDKYYAPRKAINLGYSGYRTENILWNLQSGELDFKRSPKVFRILIGTNNTDDQHYKTVHTGEQTFAGIKAIVALIQARHPASRILILKILPCGGPGDATDYKRKYNRSAQAMAALRRANELIETLADDRQVFCLDVGHVFRRADGSINTDLMPDMIHPNGAGAEAMAAALEPTLRRLLE
jgi:lysophospholipase L1-like esterase